MGLNEDKKIIDFIRSEINDSKSHISSWRRTAEYNYDFFAGKQWSAEEEELLSDANRIPIVFNRAVKNINFVTGLEIENRQETKILPRELSDGDVSDVLTQAVKWVRDETDAEDEESEAFQDMLITGMGWVETRVDFNQSIDGEIFMSRIDPLEMIWDRNAKKKNLSDAKWIARVINLTKEEFKDLFPKEEAMPSDFWGGVSTEPSQSPEKSFFNNRAERIAPKKYSVTQLQWWENKPIYSVKINNSITKMDESKFNRLKKKLLEMGVSFSQQGIRFVKHNARVYRQVFFDNSRILNKEDGPDYTAPIDGFSFHCMTGLRDRNNNTWFSLMDLMVHPQKWYNKCLSQMIRILDSNAKGGYFAEQGAFSDPARAEEDIAKEYSIVSMNPGGLAKIMKKEAPMIPQALSEILQHSISSIHEVPGISLEMLGMADRNQPIGLEFQRKQSGVTLLSTFFNSLRRYRKSQGRALCRFIQEYISDGRLIRVVGDEGSKSVPLVKENVTYEFDIIVSDSPSSPNMKQQVFGTLSQILPLIVQSGVPVPLDILDYMPVPTSLINKWKETISGNSEQASKKEQIEQLKQEEAQLDLAYRRASIEEVSSKAELNLAKANKEHALAKDEAAQAAVKMGTNIQADKNKLALEEERFLRQQQREDLKLLLEQKRKQIEKIYLNN